MFLIYGRVPTKGRNNVGTRNLRIILENNYCGDCPREWLLDRVSCPKISNFKLLQGDYQFSNNLTD